MQRENKRMSWFQVQIDDLVFSQKPWLYCDESISEFNKQISQVGTD